MYDKKRNTATIPSRCVLCGEEIPEGRMVCDACYTKTGHKDLVRNKQKDKDKRDKKYYR